MKAYTRTMLRILNAENYWPIDLLDIRMPGSTTESTIRLTNAGTIVYLDGKQYVPVNIGRSGSSQVMATDAGEQPSLTLTVSNVDVQMARLLSRAEIEGSKAILREIDRRLLNAQADGTYQTKRTRDAVQVTEGELSDVQLSETAMVCQINNVLAMLDAINIPRRSFQRKCSVAFGGIACGVDLSASPNTIVTTCGSNSTDQYIDIPDSALAEAGDPDDPDAYWENGYIVFETGPLACQARPFHHFQTVGTKNRFYVRYPFLLAPDPGDVLLLRRGCPKTKTACDERQGNVLSYEGFEELPYGQVEPAEIGDGGG